LERYLLHFGRDLAITNNLMKHPISYFPRLLLQTIGRSFEYAVKLCMLNFPQYV